MIRKPANQQHHGNLREALILAGLQILETEGLKALTLRRCAKLAGVSHAAPTHHFEGLPGLKSAIATRGYGIFERLMIEGIEAEDTPRGRVLGMCRGYLRFATEHRALFNLIFVSPRDFPPDEERMAAAASARRVLTQTCAELRHGAGGSSTTEVAVWSLVHGFAKLIEIERVVPGSGDARDVDFDNVFSFLDVRA
ncbi:TetR/AcrR family transcriptional regulator [Bauldia sp.]|uniref:TetR/AcrR family transcriptional regulator n=1 Tax=Bauldia sp. TaxID=2575872 RepID=UPI003BAA2604